MTDRPTGGRRRRLQNGAELVAALLAIKDGDYTVRIEAARSEEEVQVLGAIRGLAEALQSQQDLQREEMRRLVTRSSAAVEEERRRIAAAIHDHLNAVLIYVRLEAQRAAELSDQLEDSEASRGIREILKRMATTTADLYAAGRDIVRQLRPEVIDTLGLSSALVDLVRSVQQVHPACQFKLRVEPGFPTLKKDLTIEVYRMIQEALSNVVKHAGASNAEISLWRNPKSETVCVTVDDDGRGFDTRVKNAKGIGLISMRERAVGLGGEMTIKSAPDQGTKIVVEMPAR